MTQPANYADIRLITGEQGSGKSTTGMGFATDDYHEQLDGIVSPDGERIKAKALSKEDKEYLRKAGINPNPLKYVRVFSGSQSKIIKIPQGFTVSSPVKIFANFHVYGMYYSYISLAELFQYVNTDLFSNAWILSDESVMTDSRNSMEIGGKLAAQFGATVRKRNSHMCIMAQYTELIERRYRLFHTMKVLCSYDPNTQIVTCDVKERNNPSYSFDYWQPMYRPYFNTNELIPIPQDKIDKALAKIYG